MADRQNLLLIVADQLTPGVLGCYGGPVPTPNIDRLAAAGARFTDATCPTPFCSPSRASMSTGLYPHAHGVVHNVMRRDYPAVSSPPTEEGIETDDETLGKRLDEAGYDTRHYGKWHLMDDDLPYYPDTFREHHRYAQGMAETFRDVKRRPRAEWMDWYGWALPVEVDDRYRTAVEAADHDWETTGGHGEFLAKMGRLEFEPGQTFDVQVADHAVDRLDDVGEPFFVTASFNVPHDPNVVPSPYYERFDPDGIDLPANGDPPAERFADDWSREFVTHVGEPGVREFLRVYYGMVALLDDQVGRLLDALDARGLADETVVAFTADHGDMSGGHGMVWKSTSAFYEEVVRVPLVVRGPGVEAAEPSFAAELTDLMPTLLDLTGGEVPAHVHGRSLAPYLRGERDPDDGPTYSFGERIEPNAERARARVQGGDDAFMVRGDGWKYARYADGDEFLYDLEADPGETTDLSDDAAYADRKAVLEDELLDWLDRTGYRE